jgi:hypothetical protein
MEICDGLNRLLEYRQSGTANPLIKLVFSPKSEIPETEAVSDAINRAAARTPCFGVYSILNRMKSQPAIKRLS